jgi:hypothetical protein
MNCKGKIDSKFSLTVDLLHDKAPATTAMLKEKVEDMHC